MALKSLRTRRKQFVLDAAVLAAVETLALDTGTPLDKLADEALRDLLKKHRRPLNLKEALRDSARALPANDPAPKPADPKIKAKRSSRRT